MAIETKNEEQSEGNMKKVEEILQKWLFLQKTVKEEITLNEIKEQQKKNDQDKLKEYFRNYYDIKIKSRKTYEEIRNLKIDNSEKSTIKEYVIEPCGERLFFQAFEAVKNLLFLLRDNYDYIIKLISLIEYTDEKEQIESLVELLCNQFYDNILIPNPEQEELLILIYKLLEEEITPMNSASIDEFMHDSTFLGKFISSFMKKQELNVFLSILLNPIIASIENEDDGCLDMSLFSIQNYLKKEKIKDKNKDKGKTFPKSKGMENGKEEIVTEESMFKNIPKTGIKFKKNIEIEAEKAEENRRENYNVDTMETPNENVLNIKKNYSDNDEIKIEFNKEYEEELNQEKLTKKFKESKDNKNLKDFYEYQLEQINNDPNIFSNNGLLEVLNEQCFQNDKNQIMTKYKKNFLFIQKKVDTIIQALIDKITSIPYTVRCISKIISLLISRKFPSLSKYLQNAFIGKFIFNKFIFPVLSLENKNVVENIIFSLDTKKCLNVIISVLSTANKCILYNCNTDTEKTIFNYYLMDIIPILNKFYEKLIDIELPKTLNDLISKTRDRMEENNETKLFSFRRKQQNNTPTPQIHKKCSNTPLYDYFSENSDEILNLKCICASVYDLLFIINLIYNDIYSFKDLPRFDFFKKTVEVIRNNEHKIGSILDEENEKTHIRKFTVMFKEEYNSQIEKLFNHKKKKLNENNTKESDLMPIKIKDCIEKILTGLNLLNIKDYSYLNMATSNKKFLDAIQYTLKDLFEFSENENDIPLNWYGQFIINNLENLDNKYLENDFEKLYEELYNEETNTLNELKSYSSISITRYGMNLRCAENIIEKTNRNFKRIKKAKKLQKIETFIEKDKTEICIKIKEKDEGKNDKDKLGLKGIFGKKEGKNEPFSYISVVDLEKCPHKNIAFMASIEGERKVKNISSHAEGVNDFISKFCIKSKEFLNDTKKSDLKILNRFIIEDIRTGQPVHEVYKALGEYKELLKESIKKNKKYIESIDKEELKIELNEFTAQIEEHIMRKIYKYVYPEEPLPEDIEFNKKTKLLDWVTPEHLEMPKLFIKQLRIPINWIRKMDEAKSVMEKIDCLQNALTNVNNLIKFSTGKNKDAGADDTPPIFQYIIIKAQPERIVSNLNYIKCFYKSSSDKNLLISNLESYIVFITNVTPEQLKITKEEFDKNMKEAAQRLEINERRKKNKLFN